jgi:D-cysteine desulfhydrase
MPTPLAPLPDLARLPTPLQRLDRTSERLGVEIWIKRDDLTGLELSGNKVRKLAFLLADARAQGATVVLTTGGIQSNHCRATAACARQVGMGVSLLLRGTPPTADRLDGNLLLNAVFGAEIEWCTPDGYRQRTRLLSEMADRLRARGEVPYIISEGGSNALGSWGFVHAAHELRGQADEASLDIDSVVCAVGSGGTLAGLAMGIRGAAVHGVAVCDDRPTFRAIVQSIGEEAAPYGGELPPPGPETWDVVEDFQGRGYALSTPDEVRQQVAFARETGIVLDPVYTGKAWAAVEALAPTGVLGQRVVFWHTGGAFSWFGRGHELTEALGADLQQRGVVSPR